MRKILITTFILGILLIGGIALAAPTSTIVNTLIINGLKSAPCLTTGSGGLVTSTACGAGGAFTTTTINGLSATTYTLTASSTAGLHISNTAPGTIDIYQDQATVFVPGYIGAVDFTTFNGKVDAIRSINTGFGLTGGGDLSANRTIYFTGSFATSGTSGINIASSTGTWTWSQATSSATAAGFLQPADWVTFNNKVSSSTAINTGFGLTGGGNLTADRTIWFTGSFATSGASGINISSSSATWTFNQPTSTVSINGFLSAADFTIFNAKESALTFSQPIQRTVNTVSLGFTVVSSSRAINTAGVLLGGGDLSVNRTLYFGGIFATSSANQSSFTITSSSPTWTFNMPLKLNQIAAIATSTGALIVGQGNGTGWAIKAVGTNGLCLMASSTATGGVNWESCVAPTRTISTASGITGGGDLSANRTLWLAARFTETPGQVHVASSSAVWTFSLPQTIWVTSTVQFAGVTSTKVTVTNVSSTNLTVTTFISTSSIILQHASGTNAFKPIARLFAITVPAPTSTGTDYTTNKIGLGSFPFAVTITQINCINTPSSTVNSVTFNMLHGANDPLGLPTNLFSVGQVCSNTTTTQAFSTFNDATLAAGERTYLSFSTASSTQVTVEAFGSYDP